ncbi:hypothetical protein Desti_5562 [Desulfomonile tiedjei DSM 6799]|uniref:Uncharacterized protein n=1 Tax=Desulfomonile tiedjei (strain ATCC 49306 / DSM 6799 / DCB-1) TaxID=706587 RepID=I4CBU4_DESTA|nr:hypothetical protein Desti_4403 [Desulfomonile tiedjei DSM 6799]AFM28143.1 hypothetical protein Desti_5562 [Desulfomonile tiedjei DSM 6799]
MTGRNRVVRVTLRPEQKHHHCLGHLSKLKSLIAIATVRFVPRILRELKLTEEQRFPLPLMGAPAKSMNAVYTQSHLHVETKS